MKFKQAETLQAAYDLLKDKQINIERSHMDCGSFTNEILNVVVQNSKRFYIRANGNELFKIVELRFLFKANISHSI